MRLVFATLSGVLFAFAFPNFAIGWLIFVALIPLFLALARAESWREAFLLGLFIGRPALRLVARVLFVAV